jgi:hypothetical protein
MKTIDFLYKYYEGMKERGYQPPFTALVMRNSQTGRNIKSILAFKKDYKRPFSIKFI